MLAQLLGSVTSSSTKIALSYLDKSGQNELAVALRAGKSKSTAVLIWVLTGRSLWAV